MKDSKLHLADFTENRQNTEIPKYYGEALCEIARVDNNLVALCADLAPPTETDIFRDEFPDRYYMTGIAEANMIGLASGMAKMGDIPFVHSFCVFLTRRAYDQVAMQVAYPRTNVKLIGFIPGITTLLGVSHQAIDDIALMRALPNMCVIEPSGPEQVESAVKAIYDYNGPVYMRLNRASSIVNKEEFKSLTIGKVDILKHGKDIVIFACGLMVHKASQAAIKLKSKGIEATVVNVSTLKPMNDQTILDIAKECGCVITAENHSIIGGLSDTISSFLVENNINILFKKIGLNDTFAEGASTDYLLKKYKMDIDDIYENSLNLMKIKGNGNGNI